MTESASTATRHREERTTGAGVEDRREHSPDAGHAIWYLSLMQTADPGAARRPLVIANPSAGRGRTGRDLSHLVSALRDALGELDVATTAGARQATDLAAGAAGARRPLVISVGGDGTLHEVVNGLMRARGSRSGASSEAISLPSLGVIATGTGGDFGRTLGIAPRVRDYLAAVAGGHERAIDVGRARFAGAAGRPAERYWINVLSAGIGGLVDRYAAASPAVLGGRIAYAQAALRGIAMCHRVRLRCRAVFADGARRRTCARQPRRGDLQRHDVRRRHAHRPDGAARRRPAGGDRHGDSYALAARGELPHRVRGHSHQRARGTPFLVSRPPAGTCEPPSGVIARWRLSPRCGRRGAGRRASRCEPDQSRFARPRTAHFAKLKSSAWHGRTSSALAKMRSVQCARSMRCRQDCTPHLLP